MDATCFGSVDLTMSLRIVATPCSFDKNAARKNTPKQNTVSRELFVGKMVAVPMPNWYHLYFSPKDPNFGVVVAHLSEFFSGPKRWDPCFFTNNETLSVFFWNTKNPFCWAPETASEEDRGLSNLAGRWKGRLPSSTPALTNSGWVEHL